MKRLAFEPKFQQKPFSHDPLSDKFSDSKFFGAPAILMSTLDRKRGPVLNQKNTLRCTGFGTAANGWYIHGKLMNPDWSAAKIGQKQGRSVDGYGGDPNATMKHQRDDGFLPQEVNNKTLDNSTEAETGWKTWSPSLDVEAEKYDNISGFTKIDNRQQDYFDSIRSALQRNYDPATGRGACVDAFSAFYDTWYGETVNNIGNLVGFHRYIFVDWETVNGIPYLVAQNSYGTTIGKDGFHYFTREVVNWEFSQSGRSLKTLATLSPDMIAEARKQTALGAIVRQFVLIFQRFSDNFGRA